MYFSGYPVSRMFAIIRRARVTEEALRFSKRDSEVPLNQVKYYELKFSHLPTCDQHFFRALFCLCYFWEFRSHIYAYLIKRQHMSAH